jgi:anti-sigma factor RsiW
MRCQKARWFLSARCDGTLSARQRARLDSHLEICAECRKEAFYFSEVGALIPRLEKVAVRPDFDLRLRAAVYRAEHGVTVSGHSRFGSVRPAWRPALLAASVAGLVLAGYGGYEIYRSSRAGAVHNDVAVVSADSRTGTSTGDAALAGTTANAALIPVDGLSEEARHLQERYLAGGGMPENYVLGIEGLNDPLSKKPALNFVMPVMTTDQVARKVSY